MAAVWPLAASDGFFVWAWVPIFAQKCVLALRRAGRASLPRQSRASRALFAFEGGYFRRPLEAIKRSEGHFVGTQYLRTDLDPDSYKRPIALEAAEKENRDRKLERPDEGEAGLLTPPGNQS